MTEYDYSPEAYDRYIRKQHAISKWVRKTKEGPLGDPHTPATPAFNVYALEDGLDDSLDRMKHRRGQSYDQYDRHHYRGHEERDRDRGRDKNQDKPRSLHHSTRPANTKRYRSSSQSATLQPRSYNPPPPLPLPPQPWQMSQKFSPVGSIPPAPYPHHYPQKLVSPRVSRHSSHSSSTTRLHSPNSYFPQTAPVHNHSPDYGHYQPAPRKGRTPDFTVR